MTLVSYFIVTAAVALWFVLGVMVGMGFERARRKPEPTDSEYEDDQDGRAI